METKIIKVRKSLFMQKQMKKKTAKNITITWGNADKSWKQVNWKMENKTYVKMLAEFL